MGPAFAWSIDPQVLPVAPTYASGPEYWLTQSGQRLDRRGEKDDGCYGITPSGHSGTVAKAGSVVSAAHRRQVGVGLPSSSPAAKSVVPLREQARPLRAL